MKYDNKNNGLLLCTRLRSIRGERGARKVSPRKSVVQSACQYDVTSHSVTFKMAIKVFIEETDRKLRT